MPRDLAPDTVVDLLRQSAEAPFEEARAMPPEVYTSEAFLALEQERIFARDWYCVGRTEALSAPGDYLT